MQFQTLLFFRLLMFRFIIPLHFIKNKQFTDKYSKKMYENDWDKNMDVIVIFFFLDFYIVKYQFLMNQYTMVCKLGQGAFSTVYRVKRKQDGKEYALKKMRIANFSQKQLSNCLNEVRILASIESPYILSYKDSFYDDLSNCFCIVTQCLQGGDIFQMINRHKNNKKNIEESMIWRVAFQALKGLQTLHNMNILHRDIKSANIFFTKDQAQVKLADMNVSIVTSNGMAKTQTGTPYYASPQVWEERPYSAKCDIWSLGCVLYEMASLRPPFVSHDLKSLKKTIIGGVYKRIPSQYSNDLQDFIRLCLKVDPKARQSASQLLQNQFIKRKASTKQNHSDSVSLNCSFTRRVLLQKILAPRKKDFKNIKDKLPKNRFEDSSVDKIIENKSYYQQKNKENFVNLINTNKITKKDVLPNIRRSASLRNQKQDIIKLIQEKILCDDRPPLPKRSIRA